jgi:hypothetical protein
VEIDADIAKAVLETITQLCEPDDASKDLALKHSDYVLGNEKSPHPIYPSWRYSFLYPYATLQLLSVLLQNRRSHVQAYFLKTPAGALSFIAVLQSMHVIMHNGMCFSCSYVLCVGTL